MASCMSCLLSRSSDCRSQHFCDVCKYMLRMDQGNGHNSWCSNCVFKVYAYCHHCSTVHEVPHRLGSTMLCLSNSSLSNTTHHSPAHHHPTGVNNESTIFQGDDDMHDNNDSSNSKVVDNDSNCLRDFSDSNESFSFLNVTSTHVDSKSSSMDWMDVSSTTTHPRTRLGSYLIIQMTFLSLLNSRYHHHANWTWVHMSLSLSSCCSKTRIFCHQASLTRSWNGPVQLLPRVTSLILQLLHIEKTNGLHIPQYY